MPPCCCRKKRATLIAGLCTTITKRFPTWFTTGLAEALPKLRVRSASKACIRRTVRPRTFSICTSLRTFPKRNPSARRPSTFPIYATTGAIGETLSAGRRKWPSSFVPPPPTFRAKGLCPPKPARGLRTIFKCRFQWQSPNRPSVRIGNQPHFLPRNALYAKKRRLPRPSVLRLDKLQFQFAL